VSHMQPVVCLLQDHVLAQLQLNADIAGRVTDNIRLKSKPRPALFLGCHNVGFIRPQPCQQRHDQQVDVTSVVGNDHVKPILVLNRQRAGERRDDAPAVDKHAERVRVSLQLRHAVGQCLTQQLWFQHRIVPGSL